MTSEQIQKAGPLSGHVAVVTGASSGIGRAIALALSRQGAKLCIVGRDASRLEEAAAAIRQFSEVTSLQLDLTVEADVEKLLGRLESDGGRLDILVHSAGVIHQNTMERARIEDLDLQFETNVRVPYIVTQSLLPLLTTARGQVVFINSSVGLVAKRPEVGQYAATKHALRAIADSLREEVNPKGIRVVTLYLGRTATPMQETLLNDEGMVYRPETLLQPADIATMVVQVLMLPPTAEVTDIAMRPMIRSET